MSQNHIRYIKDIIQRQVAIAAQSKKITHEVIEGTYEEVIKKFRVIETHIFDAVSIDDVTFRDFFETARRQYLSTHPIKIEQSSALLADKTKTWLTSQRDLTK